MQGTQETFKMSETQKRFHDFSFHNKIYLFYLFDLPTLFAYF